MGGSRRRSAKIAGLIAAALCANVAPAAALRLAVSSPCAGFSAAAAAARSSGARSRQFAPRCGLPALALTSAAISTKLVAAAKVAASPIRPPPPAWLSFGRWQLLLGQELAGAAVTAGVLAFLLHRSKRLVPWDFPSPLPESISAWAAISVLFGLGLPLVLHGACLYAGVSSLAAAAAFVPHYVVFALQIAAMRFMGVNQSSAWPLVPIPFTLWRIFQVWRAQKIIEASASGLLLLRCMSHIAFPFWILSLMIHVGSWPMFYSWPRKEGTTMTTVLEGSSRGDQDAQRGEGGRMVEAALESIENVKQEWEPAKSIITARGKDGGGEALLAKALFDEITELETEKKQLRTRIRVLESFRPDSRSTKTVSKTQAEAETETEKQSDAAE